jgi:hypothetical protein
MPTRRDVQGRATLRHRKSMMLLGRLRKAVEAVGREIAFVDEHAVAHDDNRVHVGKLAVSDAVFHRAEQGGIKPLLFR